MRAKAAFAAVEMMAAITRMMALAQIGDGGNSDTIRYQKDSGYSTYKAMATVSRKDGGNNMSDVHGSFGCNGHHSEAIMQGCSVLIGPMGATAALMIGDGNVGVRSAAPRTIPIAVTMFATQKRWQRRALLGPEQVRKSGGICAAYSAALLEAVVLVGPSENACEKLIQRGSRREGKRAGDKARGGGERARWTAEFWGCMRSRLIWLADLLHGVAQGSGHRATIRSYDLHAPRISSSV
eukprot:6180204-Pleurochrysis_carterae.AAC.3